MKIALKQGVEADAQRMKVVRDKASRLLEYCRRSDFAGYDPYDAMNSRLFNALPFLHFKLARQVLTQANKRSPINLRPLLLIPRSHNAKGLALFVSSLEKLSRLGLFPAKEIDSNLIEKLVALRSPATKYWCWGYNFAWQTRVMLVPKGSPNIICTSFVANALLDAYERNRDARCLEMAVSAADFILDVLFWSEGEKISCFNYTPLWRSQVHNASLLGSALLCRVFKETGEKRFLEPAVRAARYSVGKQYPDGSWDYGESDSPPQRWKDNFHTGFNLCALQNIERYGGAGEFARSIRLGFDYYLHHFFGGDWAPKYFDNATYPIDIHSASQSIVTFLALKDLDERNVQRARNVFNWTTANMWDERGFFYFQKRPAFTIKVPYMRWSQAWMLFALASLLENGGEVVADLEKEGERSDTRSAGTAQLR
jgi:hypothetical protein